MKNRARVTSDQNVVTNAKIELLGPDDEYVDISRCVTSAKVDLTVGQASRTHLELLTAEVLVETAFLTEGTLKAFAHILSLHGWKLEPPGVRECTTFGAQAHEFIPGLQT